MPLTQHPPQALDHRRARLRRDCADPWFAQARCQGTSRRRVHRSAAQQVDGEPDVIVRDNASIHHQAAAALKSEWGVRSSHRCDAATEGVAESGNSALCGLANTQIEKVPKYF
jgi:transposase-like protein